MHRLLINITEAIYNQEWYGTSTILFSQCFLNIMWKPDIYNWFLFSLKKKQTPKQHYTALKEKTQLHYIRIVTTGEGMTADAQSHDSRKHNIYLLSLNYIFCRLEMTSGQTPLALKRTWDALRMTFGITLFTWELHIWNQSCLFFVLFFILFLSFFILFFNFFFLFLFHPPPQKKNKIKNKVVIRN